MEDKVLSMYQPWALFLVHKIKKIETRPSPTNWTIEKGIYLIHAAKEWNRELSNICFQEPFYSALNKLGYWSTMVNSKGGSHRRDLVLPLGCIIGSVEVKECAKIHKDAFDKAFIEYKDQSFNHYVDEPELSFGNYTPGRYAWICQNPRVLINPIPYKGGQGYYQKFTGDKSQLIFK